MNDPTVQQGFNQAWQQSNPDAPFVPQGQPGSQKQEQGGWILQSLFGGYSVDRVPGGTRNSLDMGAKPLCLLFCSVVGDFHTHPNWNSEGYDGYIVDDADHAATMTYQVPTVILTHQGPIIDPYPPK